MFKFCVFYILNKLVKNMLISVEKEFQNKQTNIQIKIDLSLT